MPVSATPFRLPRKLVAPARAEGRDEWLDAVPSVVVRVEVAGDRGSSHDRVGPDDVQELVAGRGERLVLIAEQGGGVAQQARPGVEEHVVVMIGDGAQRDGLAG